MQAHRRSLSPLAVLLAALALAAAPGSAAAAQPTAFPVDEFVHGILDGRLFLGGTAPKVVGAKDLKEFKRGGRYAYVIQLGVRRAGRDSGDGTFTVLEADTYGAAIAHLLGLSPGTIRALQVMFPQALPRKARFPTLRARITYSMAVADPSFLLERGRFALAPHPVLDGVLSATSLFGIRPGTYPLIVRARVTLAPHPLKTIYSLVDWGSLALNPLSVFKTRAGYAWKSLKHSAAASFTDTEVRYMLEVPALAPRLIGRSPASARSALQARALNIAVESVPTTDSGKLGPGGASRVFEQGVAPGKPVHPHATVTVRAYTRSAATPPAGAFAISALTIAPTQKLNGRAGDMVVAFGGHPVYPLQATVAWTGCPAGLQCAPQTRTGLGPDSLEGSHVVLVGVAGCRGDIKVPATVSGTLTLRDAGGAQTAPRAFTFTCQP